MRPLKSMLTSEYHTIETGSSLLEKRIKLLWAPGQSLQLVGRATLFFLCDWKCDWKCEDHVLNGYPLAYSLAVISRRYTTRSTFYSKTL